MNNSRDEILRYFMENNLPYTGLTYDFFKNINLDNSDEIKNALEKQQDYINYKTDLSNHIMESLRERRGYDKYDITHDKDILKCSKESLLYDLFAWNGLVGYDDLVKEWIKEIYKVDLDEIE